MRNGGASASIPCGMVRGGQSSMPEVAPAMAAYLGVRRRREKASSVAMRRLQSTSIANQDSAVVQAMAMDAAAFVW